MKSHQKEEQRATASRYVEVFRKRQIRQHYHAKSTLSRDLIVSSAQVVVARFY